jgi:PKD repeat protein
MTSHIYAFSGGYSVSLTITDNHGATASQTKTVIIANVPPSASFVFSCNGLTCNFDGSSSSDSDGTINRYVWNFGDGGPYEFGPIQTHTYGSAGTFNVSLQVDDNGGATASTSHAVTTTQPEVHIGDLDGATQRAANAWTATVTITVHDANHNAVAGAAVSGTWSPSTPASCTTNAIGQCSVSLSVPNKTSSVTFTVSGVASGSATYKPANNHDPDGDSNGTGIILRKP